jgi:hypothetical protein
MHLFPVTDGSGVPGSVHVTSIQRGRQLPIGQQAGTFKWLSVSQWHGRQPTVDTIPLTCR